MVASATLRAAIFPTRSCICKMSMTKDSQLTVATISVGTGKYISENGYGKIQYTAPVKVQRPVLANIPCTVESYLHSLM